MRDAAATAPKRLLGASYPAFSLGTGGADRWLPGQLRVAVASGGTDSVAYPTAGLVLLAYGAIVVIVSALVFQRRDVTA